MLSNQPLRLEAVPNDLVAGGNNQGGGMYPCRWLLEAALIFSQVGIAEKHDEPELGVLLHLWCRGTARIDAGVAGNHCRPVVLSR